MLKVILVAVVALLAAADTKPASSPITPALDEVRAGLAQRALNPQFEQWKAFVAGRLDRSAGGKTFSDKDDRCRLPWVDHLLRNPLEAPDEAEAFTRELHAAASLPRDGVKGVVAIAAGKLGAADVRVAPTPNPGSREAALNALKESLHAARGAFASAWTRNLSDAERKELTADLYRVTTLDPENVGAIFADSKAGGRLADLLVKLDRGHPMAGAAAALVRLTEPGFYKSLLPGARKEAMLPTPGVKGTVMARVETPDGAIVFGSDGHEEYDLDAMTGVSVIIDPGGDDTYLEGAVSPERPLLIVVDLAGNDTYRGKKPGIQGGALLGVSMLIDAAGDDTYDAQDVAQGAALGGVGILIDHAGKDTYRGDRRTQGSAMGGIGILIDRAGDDSYHAALLAQGVGGPLGFGLLDDLMGNDTYYAGGKYPGGYPDTPGYGGWSQGIGAGPRGSANGGLGVLLDGGGDDTYEFDYMSHGGGYWFAAGFARDFGGNDQRLGATRTMFDGSERKVARFVRWGVGFACHYAVGFIFDDAGDDLYGGNFACDAYAYDVSVAGIFDLGGNDKHTAADHGGAAQAHYGALSILYDASGDDAYAGTQQGAAGSDFDTGEQKDVMGGNFAFLIDHGGKDDYGAGVANDTVLQRGWTGGFLLDRKAGDRPAAPATQPKR